MTNRSGSSRRVSIRVVQVVVLAAGGTLLPVPAALAAPADPCERQTNNTYRKLLECVTLEECGAPGGLAGDRRRERRPVLPGHPAAGTEGYDSVEYVAA